MQGFGSNPGHQKKTWDELYDQILSFGQIIEFWMFCDSCPIEFMYHNLSTKEFKYESKSYLYHQNLE